MAKGNKLCTGGSDNHLILWDLRPLGLTGSKIELTCDKAHITLNKNAVCGDRSALSPGGVRIGTPALTTCAPPLRKKGRTRSREFAANQTPRTTKLLSSPRIVFSLKRSHAPAQPRAAPQCSARPALPSLSLSLR